MGILPTRCAPCRTSGVAGNDHWVARREREVRRRSGILVIHHVERPTPNQDVSRRRITCFVCAACVVALGLGSRRYGAYLPEFIALYAGDTLWALMVYLGVGVLAPAAQITQRATVALGMSYAVEVSQLYHAKWIDAIRHTTAGALVLGFDFLWSDLVCYAVGVAVGAGVEAFVLRERE